MDILTFADAEDIKVIRFFEEEACGENVEGRPQFRNMVEFCFISFTAKKAWPVIQL